MSKAIHRVPLALASDGTILINLHHARGDDDLDRLLQLAHELGGVVFVGMVATHVEATLALRHADDAATAIAAEILGHRMHHR